MQPQINTRIRKVLNMRNKTLVIASVGTIIGLFVGVIIGYSVSPSLQTTQAQDLQNQIDNLQNQVSSLQNQITQKDSQIQTLQQEVNGLEALLGPIRKGDWNLIETLQGSSGLKTDYFHVVGTELRINWTWVSSIEQFASFSIYLYKEGQSVYTEALLFLQDEGTTFAHNIESAYYYLDISGANLDQWTVTVEVWIPE